MRILSKKKINNSYYSLFYCYLKGSGNISFFHTTIKSIKNERFLFNSQNLKSMNFDKCLFTKKTIYFNFALQYCLKNYPNKFHFNIKLYAKMSNFSSDCYFKIDLVKSKYAYLNCSIPFVSEFKKFTYIDCILDRLKFPILDIETITLPTQLYLQDIDILYWNFIDKEYNISSCIPEYTFVFTPEKYNDSYCFKAYNSLFSTFGQISRGNSNNTKNASNYYNFEINAIVDGKFTKFPCELKNLNFSNSSNNYLLSCLVYGNNTAEIFNTMVVDNNPEYNYLIYINISYNYTLKRCDPTKIIVFKSTDIDCIPGQNISNINLYADMKGFLAEEEILLYFEYPSYIYANCTIPKSRNDSSEQYIHCIIDTKKFPLNNYHKIVLPNEFIKNPGPDYGFFNLENIKVINIKECHS